MRTIKMLCKENRKLTLEEAKNSYIKRSREIFDETERLSSESYGIAEIFTKSKLMQGKAKLKDYYACLKECDEAYAQFFTLGGAIGDLNMKNAKLAVVERSRSVFLSSLNGYERELSNIEASTNFKLSTGIAIVAVVISMFGLAIA
ncbi:hypothetical protein ACR0ST_10265 [Aliidiomarina sp. Khilg15.8]